MLVQLAPLLVLTPLCEKWTLGQLITTGSSLQGSQNFLNW
jgi:hypothetical protein